MVERAVPVDQTRQPGESSRPGAVAVGVTSVIVLQRQPFRKEATFTNDSDTVIFLAKGSLATLNAGIRLNANGGLADILPDTTGRIYVGPISAICSLAAKNLCFTEDW